MMHSCRSTRALAVLTVATLTAITGCSGDGSSAVRSTSTTTVATRTRVKATRLFVQVATAGQPVEFPPADEAAVLHAVERYITDATIAPLEGRRTDIDRQLAPAALLTITDADRTALTDAGVPRAKGAIKVSLPRVNLRALAERDGSIDLIGSTLLVDVTATTATGPLKIHREGQLMFARDGADWKILGFTLTVSRDGAGVGDLASSSSTSEVAP